MNARARPIDRVVTPRVVLEGAGVRLRRSIGGPELDYLDPFLLLDHFASDDPRDYEAGFPMHPHRGIETVTYMQAGEVDHRDSIGNAGTIGPGDVQWMTAGGGIMHEEMPRGRDGRMAGFQLWVNLPAGDKMMRPRYQGVEAVQIPVARLGAASARVIAGTLGDVRGPVRDIVADPVYADVAVPAGEEFELPLPPGHTVFAYVYEGAGELGAGDRPDAVPRLAVLGAGEVVRVVAGSRPFRFLLVAGRPLGEPIARYGPFVMTTRAEIEQALRDLRDGTFVWRDDRGS